MGYSESLCQICGVSFNIARIRRPDEPRSAGWIYYGEEGFVKGESIMQCGRKAGCMIVDRNLEEDVFKNPWEKKEQETDGDDGGENEEFASNAEDDEDEPDFDEFDDPMSTEHIAGPGCNCVNGFSGHRLSLPEMENCRIFQCLVRKTDSFQPAADDEPFERDEPFFLSGLSDGMPEITMQPHVHPVRHDIEHPNATNGMIESQYSDVHRDCMPFHPWCLEIFKRASQSKTGAVDMAGLWGWYENEADFKVFLDFPRHGPTRKLQQQWWNHRRGTEWIACNPLFVPGLPSTLQNAISTDPSFDVGKGAFDIPADQLTTTSEQDPFTTLPIELRLIILQDLSSKDIASLRLTSRTFRQLPISLWHHLLQTEMPWFWEASSTISSSLPTYSFWTTTTAARLKSSPIPPSSRHATPVPDIPDPKHTNWHQLYLLLKNRNNDDDDGYQSLRGLRNRERIWNDCEEILRRIENYRHKGEIPVDDVARIVHERYEEARRRNMAAGARKKKLLQAAQEAS